MRKYSSTQGVGFSLDSNNAKTFLKPFKLVSTEKFTIYLEKNSNNVFYKITESGSKLQISIDPLTNAETTLTSDVDMFTILSTSDPVCDTKRKIFTDDEFNDISYDKVNFYPFKDPHTSITVFSDLPILPKLSLARPSIVEYFIRHKPDDFKKLFLDIPHRFEFRSPSLTKKQWDKLCNLHDTQTLLKLMELIQGKGICKPNKTPSDTSFSDDKSE